MADNSPNSNWSDLKEALNLFTYQGQMERYAPKHGTPLPLDAMLADVRGMSSLEWASYAFGRDPLRGRLTPEQMLDLAQRALDCGREEAERLRAAYGQQTEPSAIAQRLGIHLTYPDMPNGGGQVVFAQFEEPDKITVFMDTVNKANEMLRTNAAVREILGDRSIKQVLIAHEIFHYVELSNKDEIFTQSYKLRLWKVGPFRNDSRISCLAEIAGMEFARTLLGIPFCPYLYDIFFVYLYGDTSASDLYRSICRMCGHPSIEQQDSGATLTQKANAEIHGN